MTEARRRQWRAALAARTTEPEWPRGTRVPSAVVIPIFEHEDEPHLLFIERSATLAHHPGQLGFPGGKIEPGDASAWAAACREAHEELQLKIADGDRLGALDPVPAGARYLVEPFVAAIGSVDGLVPEPGEVAAVHTWPLRAFLETTPRWETRRLPDRPDAVPVAFYDLDGGTVWGASARMVQQLVAALDG